MKTIKNKILSTIHSIKATADSASCSAAAAVLCAKARARTMLRDEKGTFVVEHGAVMLIILVVAALAIVLLKTLLNDTLAPTIKSKMLEFFN